MSSLPEKLADLNQRLQSITQLATEQDDSIKVEDTETGPATSKYICAECAWTTSTNAAALARHFTLKHASHLKCPDCKSLCESQEGLKKHQSQKHSYLLNECKHHDPRQSQPRVPANIGTDVLSPTTGDQTIGGKASVNVQSILNRKGSVQSGSCPDPACQLTFLDFNTLYEHFVRSHPLYITDHGHSKPFKCPFCARRYQINRFVSGHVRTHKPKSLGSPGTGDAEDQENLIRQSHIAMAHRRSRSNAEAQAQADRTSSDEEADYSIQMIEEEGYFLISKDDVIYIDEGVEPESPIPERLDQTNVAESRRFKEATPVGLMLHVHPADSYNSRPENEKPSVDLALRTHTPEPKLSDLMDLDDNYSERFALDKDELPSRTSNSDPSILTVQLSSEIFYQSLSCEIIRALQIQHFVTVSEVADLFFYFLNEYQRTYVLQELGSIDLDKHDSSILAALHQTDFKTLLDAWVEFKRLAIRHAPQLIRQANNQGAGLSKSITWALLQYCQNLKTMIYRNEINIAHHFLRDLPPDNSTITIDAPFPHLVAALAERVKSRINHDSSIVFTNEMILRGAGDYVKILQTVLRPL